MPVHQEWNCSSLPLLGQNKSPRVYWGRDVWCSCKEKRELNLGRCWVGQHTIQSTTDALEEKSQKSHHHLVSVGCQRDSAYWPLFHRSRSWVSSRLRDLPSPRVSTFMSQLRNSYVLPSAPPRRWETQFPIPFSTWPGCLLTMFTDYILWNTAHSLIHQILIDNLSWVRCYARHWDHICE